MKILLFLFLGASLGSFLGLVIDRFPQQSIIAPASHCNHCKKQLKAWDLIPIVSQLSTHSKCRYCQAKIPYWYLLLEISSAFLVVLTAYQVLSFATSCVLLTGLVLGIYDIKHREYPLVVWLVLTFIALLFSSLNWLFFFFLALAYLAEKVNLKIGSGDLLYLATLALIFPYTNLLWLIQISSILGLVTYFYFYRKALPFIPFLWLASIPVLLIF
ncbi:prepilin peptidase [Streptococcus gallinaceus]|uniref:Leader peptidase (Prepilin peptidase)/N-methyltransferase n=1 Tax=Streptococcus gallinaceus TaxID=165758 RepID=A0ABV2JJV3_9STRE|nr:A24 family peptidase [Streptococcus gallinaceus]MCP1638839.1 leader peptidase (prepilin peptidase)/N-methyltransferase [Streptococcus gallinaceus]MCP1769917.1 leader peptidase (prepilin peptidase)/N-methyltransferase [Streptococcus gallinaceus]